jgi:hypothetical protein
MNRQARSVKAQSETKTPNYFGALYFGITFLETLALLLYSTKQQSSPSERVWLHFSAEWLALLGLLLFVCAVFLILTIVSLRSRPFNDFISKRFGQNPGSLWLVMIASIGLMVALSAILVQEDIFFGDFLAIYRNLKMSLYWLLLVSLQTFFFTFLWYCVNFMETPAAGVPAARNKEIMTMLAVFAVSLLVKVVFVLPDGYGMLKDVGETKYLYMLQYFNEGIFLRSATEFTTHYPPLYPLLLSFTYSLQGFTYTVIKLVNALAASSLVFPLYLLARRFLDKKHSLAVIIISSLIPFQFLLPIRLLSENLYFPLLLWAFYLVFTRPADARFRFMWDCLTGFVLGLLYLTRYISLVLIPFLMLIWWVKPFSGVNSILKISARKVLHALMVLFIALVTFIPWVNIGLDNHLPLSQMLGFGIAADTNPAQLTLLNLLKWIAFYGAYFVLLAAPLLNLLGIAGSKFKLGNLDDEKNRWFLALLLIMLAFGIAIVRHSWRADYNLELPQRLMGRYVIYFVPFFVISAFLAKQLFQKGGFRNLLDFLLRCEVIPLALVSLSYLLVIRGSLLPVNGEFIHPLISIDGYYIKILGPAFFVLLFLIYTGTNLLLWFERKDFLRFTLLGLVLYYLVGQPAYLHYMKAQQTSQQMGMQALNSMQAANRKSGKTLSYEILLPESMSQDELDDAAWTIFIQHPQSQWEVSHYYPEKIERITSDAAVVLLPQENAVETPPESFVLVQINGENYRLWTIVP